MSLSFTLLIYTLLLVLVGLAGGSLPHVIKLTHARMQMIISFVGGLMLGIGILHLMPHAFVQLESIDRTAAGVVVGITSMFIFLRWFHFHEHELPETFEPEASGVNIQTMPHAHDHAHDHDHDHDRSSQPDGHAPINSVAHCHHPRHRPTWGMIFSGLAIHTLLDGMALGASLQSDLSHNHLLWPGLGTYLAIVLHKPLDAVTISSLMMREQVSFRTRSFWIIGYCLICPIGAILFLSGIQQLGEIQQQILGMVLAFSAGIFICIALSDLLPEIEFHSHDRVKLTALVLAGIGLAMAISWVEPTHQHQLSPPVIEQYFPPGP